MNDTLKNFLAEVADLPDFTGISPVGLHTRDHFGSTPLHVAAVRGDIQTMTLLLEAGADINAPGEHGYTPLHEATEQGHLDAVRLLLERGATPAATNDDGKTPLALARLLEESVIEQLLQ